MSNKCYEILKDILILPSDSIIHKYFSGLDNSLIKFIQNTKIQRNV